MELIVAAGPHLLWILAAYRGWCFVRHTEPRPAVAWPLSLAALLWLALLSRTVPKEFVAPMLLERLSFSLIPSGYPPPAPPAPVEFQEAESLPPEVDVPPEPAFAPPDVEPAPAPPPRRRKKRAPAPEPLPDL